MLTTPTIESPLAHVRWDSAIISFTVDQPLFDIFEGSSSGCSSHEAYAFIIAENANFDSMVINVLTDDLTNPLLLQPA